MKVVPLRLQPGNDLRRALEAWMAEQQEQAGCVISADLEIPSLCGTLSPNGAHLCAGSLVRTTAELVIGLLPDWRFNRELDPATG
jgi:predicted DNA-binding protein with PD1-like motif